jgi:membrane fusion protein (multidrug efflux system)
MDAYMNRSIINMSLVLLGSLSLIGCGGSKDKSGAGASGGKNAANAPVPVTLFEAHLQPVIYYDQYPATVTALMQVDIHPETEGYVTGIFFKEGSHVHKGQVLYEIDKSKYQASYDQATANVRSAQENQAQSQKDADRYNYLNQHDAIAKQVLDHAITTLNTSKDQVNAAKQEQKKAQTDLKYATIRAPFDGTIGISQVKLGNTVNVGQTVLNTISTDGPMAVDFVVNEKQVPRFIKLKNQNSASEDSLFTILMADNTLYQGLGKLSVIDRGVDPLTGTIKIRIVFPNKDGLLRAGMSCTMRVHNEDKQPQIVIPSKAIVEQVGEYFVYIAMDTMIKDSTNNKTNAPNEHSLRAEQHKVILGQTIGPNVVVKSGLEEGDKVITDGVQKLKDGSPVTTQSKAGPQAGGGAPPNSGDKKKE